MNYWVWRCAYARRNLLLVGSTKGDRHGTKTTNVDSGRHGQDGAACRGTVAGEGGSRGSGRGVELMSALLFYLTLGSTLGCGLIAGVFFAFSSFVMPALAKLPPAQGLAAMQSINVVV